MKHDSSNLLSTQADVDCKKTKYDIRRMKNVIETYRQKYAKMAICLTSKLTYTHKEKDDTVAIKDKADEIMVIWSSLDLKTVG